MRMAAGTTDRDFCKVGLVGLSLLAGESVKMQNSFPAWLAAGCLPATEAAPEKVTHVLAKNCGTMRRMTLANELWRSSIRAATEKPRFVEQGFSSFCLWGLLLPNLLSSSRPVAMMLNPKTASAMMLIYSKIPARVPDSSLLYKCNQAAVL